MEARLLNSTFWKDRKVLITGHTGFKGSWLSLWLHKLGAKLCGYALDPPTKPSLFEDIKGKELFEKSITADIRDRKSLEQAIAQAEPELVFHLAAQPLVLDSYSNPIETFEVNAMGTANLLDALRTCESLRAIVNVTTDKVYENKEWIWGYRENDRLGGYDPYSTSKTCSEHITTSFRRSFFPENEYQKHQTAIASARAGNVIGGGDWSENRLIPDCIRAFLFGKKAELRNPGALRPWQHVLEPLHGYLLLAESLHDQGTSFSGAWNFGPREQDVLPVEELVKQLCAAWFKAVEYEINQQANAPHEANVLRLDCSKAHKELSWQPVLSIQQTLKYISDWYNAYEQNSDLRMTCSYQIEEYTQLLR